MTNEDWMQIIEKDESAILIYCDWLEEQFGSQDEVVIAWRTYVANGWSPGDCTDHPHKPAWIWEKNDQVGTTGYGIWLEEKCKTKNHILPEDLFDCLHFSYEELPKYTSLPSKLQVIGFIKKHFAIQSLIFALRSLRTGLQTRDSKV